MKDQALHITNAILFDEDMALKGDREVREVHVEDNIITVTIAVEEANDVKTRYAMEDAIRDAIQEQIPGTHVRIISLAIDGEDEPQAACAHGHSTASELPPKKPIPGVKRVWLVCSAKGGVGKSTVALNTALALKAQGHTVGLLDLDLYGPSIPALVGSDLPPIVVGNLIVPPEIHGLNVLSIGFMIEKDQPLMWRGPMVAGVINQLLWEVDWSGNDDLVIDMPPGTGDTYLSILQSIQVDAAIIVTTPSELALADVRRGVAVFEPYGVKIAGVVENMATYDWEGRESVLRLLDDVKVLDDKSQKSIDRIRKILDTTRTIHIFGTHTQALCDEIKLPLIASIPLDIALQNDNDSGTPYMLNPKKKNIQASFETIAKFLCDMA
ncbi:MAG: P-loop NTPase [Proteobacteria bacterium]|nr:P-loop NTPase [Pseudomonadota bacterium]